MKRPPSHRSASARRASAAAAPDAAVHEREARMELALDLANLGTWSWDLAAGTGYLDARAAAIVGLLPGPVADIAAAQRASIHPDDLARVQADVAAGLASDDAFTLAYRVIHPDGSLHHVLTRARRSTDAAGHPVALVGTNHDNTAARDADAALRASEARLQQAVALAQLGICNWNYPRGEMRGNDERFRMVGLDPQRGVLTEQEFVALIHPDERDAIWASIIEQLRIGGAFSAEYRIIRPDGMVRWLSEAGRVVEWRQDEPLRVSSVLLDITARYTAAAALRESEERLRLLVASVQDYAIFTLDPYGRVTSWNEGARRLKGYTAEEIVGQPMERFYTAEDLATALPTRERATALLDGRSEDEGWRVRQDGSRVWINEIVTPLVGDDGTHLGFTKISRDLTVRKAAEDAIARALAAEQQARAALEEAGRLRDEFLATVSHELRTPVTAMLGYAHLLAARPHDAAYVARTADKLTSSAKTQATLVEDLLDVSRSLTGTLRVTLAPLELMPVVQAAIDTVRPTIDAKAIQLRLALSRTDTALFGDGQRLQQVVWNLLSNAVKFTPAGGRIDVELQPVDGQVQLLIRDTGQGISAAFLPHVFERFRQADGSSTRAAGGLGLGLAIAKQLVELHGGTIEVHSAGEGQGTTVRVALQRSGVARTADTEPDTPERARGDGGPQPLCPPELAGLRVLVVDDQAEIVELLDETLSACGADVRCHTAAAAALAELRAWQPDVLIADIAMPERDGYWLIRQVRALPPEQGGTTPALALTAYVRVEDRLRVLHAGYQLFVPKPVEPAELRASVARLTQLDTLGTG